jgi:hypothetical protein
MCALMVVCGVLKHVCMWCDVIVCSVLRWCAVPCNSGCFYKGVQCVVLLCSVVQFRVECCNFLCGCFCHGVYCAAVVHWSKVLQWCVVS